MLYKINLTIVITEFVQTYGIQGHFALSPDLPDGSSCYRARKAAENSKA